MLITFAFERRRQNGLRAVVLPGDEDPEGAAVLIVDVSSPEMIAAATAQSAVVKSAFEYLARGGVSALYPGFDLLTIKDGEIDRMIELKSSGVDAQVQAMSWNEWKTAGGWLRGRVLALPRGKPTRRPAERVALHPGCRDIFSECLLHQSRRTQSGSAQSNCGYASSPVPIR